MSDVVIVSTARTPIGKAYRGAFNATKAPTMAGHVVRSAVARAGIEPGEVDDVIVGCAIPSGTAGWNLGRMSALAAELPVSVPGMTVDRQCSSGLMAIAQAARQVLCEGQSVVVAAGLESISLVQKKAWDWALEERDDNVLGYSPSAYMEMLRTAEVVSQRYQVDREAQDEYALQSQRRAATAQAAGAFHDEIAGLVR